MSDSPTTLPPLPVWLNVPAFWPMAMAAEMAKESGEIYAKHLKFIGEEIKVHEFLRSSLASPNQVRLDLRTMFLRDYGAPGGIPTLVDAPYAGHDAVIADYDNGQSLVQTLLANGNGHVVLTDWKSATDDMKDLEIDNYLADLVVAIDDLGGRVNLVGLCQGGWMSTMIAARFPEKVNSLVLAGAPIDTQAGDGPLKHMVNVAPLQMYRDMVALGGGLMRGKLMLHGWKSMNPTKHLIADRVDLFEHIDDPVYVAKTETFDSWYENPLDLPGRWYLQAIEQLFMQNRLANGEFVGLGRKLDLRRVTCPTYLLAGAGDEITPAEQVFAAAKLFGTPSDRIVQKTVPGGHIGLFMGARTLKDHWPSVAKWIAAQ